MKYRVVAFLCVVSLLCSCHRNSSLNTDFFLGSWKCVDFSAHGVGIDSDIEQQMRQTALRTEYNFTDSTFMFANELFSLTFNWELDSASQFLLCYSKEYADIAQRQLKIKSYSAHSLVLEEDYGEIITTTYLARHK